MRDIRLAKCGPTGSELAAFGAREGEAGVTLLEILVVMAILGMLIGLVAPAALQRLGSAKESVARQSIERLSGILDLYKLDAGLYPSTAQGLQALIQQPGGSPVWNGPYVKGSTVPLDPWNRPYIYRSPSTRANHDFDLCSQGPNVQQTGQTDLICNP
jgi:general secretion pathway protein G